MIHTLQAQNVILRSNACDKRGFTAKASQTSQQAPFFCLYALGAFITPFSLSRPDNEHHTAALSQISDFGLSAKMGLDETHIEGAHHGTLSHMAPEVLREGRQSKASDV